LAQSGAVPGGACGRFREKPTCERPSQLVARDPQQTKGNVTCYVGKSFRDSTIFAKVQQMAQWLIIVSWVAVILGLLTALAIAFDVTAHPQHMKIMNVVWPITGLYLPVLGGCFMPIWDGERR
jgi:hypothetical protein